MIYETPSLLPLNFNDEMEKENEEDAKIDGKFNFIKKYQKILIY